MPWNTDKGLSENTKDKISKANEGRLAWNKGLKGYINSGSFKYTGGKKLELRDKSCPNCKKLIMRKSKSCRSCHQKGEKGVNWQGNNIGYGGLHRRIRVNKIKMKECVYCGSEENLNWANIDNEYSFNLDDYIPLCHSCHMKFDAKKENRGNSIKKFSEIYKHKKGGDVHELRN